MLKGFLDGGPQFSLSWIHPPLGFSLQTLLQGPQEVTYAQLDHRTLTQRGNREVSPQAMAEPCMYAVITR